MKDANEVITEFNELVNMTADELESWLKSDDSNSAGWPKDSAQEDGETVGHDSGRKITDILRANPEKKPDKYTDEQVAHMRKVVAYCKRHLAQESKGNQDKSAKEVKGTKSYASLKNWGHDFLKAQGHSNGNTEKAKSSESDSNDKPEVNGSHAGDKRKKTAQAMSANKKRETGKRNSGQKSAKQDQGANQDEGPEDVEEGDSEEDEGEEDNGSGGEEEKMGNGIENNEEVDTVETEDVDGNDEEDSKHDHSKSKSNNNPSKGDTVSWSWGAGHPEGKVLDVKEEKTTITTKRGNKVSRNGEPDDPAIVLDTGKSKAIKSAHELD